MYNELFYKNFGKIAIGIFTDFKIGRKYNYIYRSGYLHLGFITIYWNQS